MPTNATQRDFKVYEHTRSMGNLEDTLNELVERGLTIFSVTIHSSEWKGDGRMERDATVICYEAVRIVNEISGPKISADDLHTLSQRR